MQNDNDLNAGDAAGANSDPSDSGSQGANTPVSSMTPDNQNGNPPTNGRDDTARLREEIKRLNQAVVDAKRGNRNNPKADLNGDDPFDSPEGRYAVAIKLATGDLRNKIEDIISLYPELPADEISRIRKNPWAFASHDSYVNADWETASNEIEQIMLTRAEEIAASKPAPNSPIPANVNTNPVDNGADAPNANPEEDLWNMPLDQLEGLKDKAVAKVSKSK